jgi:hypothetical protein
MTTRFAPSFGRCLLPALVAAALVGAPAAHADGDPASDYLLGRATFVPPDIGVPPAYAEQLVATVRDAKARGFTIRVALIGSRYDMGAVTILYEKPKRYARFLGQELVFLYKQRLLVVMPNGLAVSIRGKPAPREQAVVDRIPPPGTNGAALATAGTKAVVRLAAAAGIVVPEAPLAAAGRGTASSATRDRITITVAAAAVALLAALVVLYRRRRARHAIS